jgi:hypothetical protein
MKNYYVPSAVNAVRQLWESIFFLTTDKNSLWTGSNIQKKELYVKAILAQDLGFVFGRKADRSWKTEQFFLKLSCRPVGTKKNENISIMSKSNWVFSGEIFG